MKKTKVLISVIVAVALLVLSVVSAFAVPAPWNMGDVNTDRDRNIQDATAVQKYSVGVLELTKLQMALADVNGDEDVNIKDATLIQKVVVGELSREDMAGDDPFTYIVCNDFMPSFDSGMAMVGTPVTFTVDAESPASPLSYEFYVDDVLVQERGDSNSFTYTFETAANYNIKALIYNCYDESSEDTIYSYKVVEPYTSETPVVSLLHMYSKSQFVYMDTIEMKAVAGAMFGTAPYEYNFAYSYWVDGEPSYTHYETGFTLVNEFPFEMEIIPGDFHAEVTVTVRDANGQTASKTYTVR